MRDYEKELLDKIATLEKQVNDMKITSGLNDIWDLICEAGLENDPRYKEGARKISEGLCDYIGLTCQLKARIWQKNDIIEQLKSTKIGKYLLSKCKVKETF